MKKGAWTLLRAMTAAAEADLLDAEKALGLLDARPAPVLRRRRILRTALLAAALSALFRLDSFLYMLDMVKRLLRKRKGNEEGRL